MILPPRLSFFLLYKRVLEEVANSELQEEFMQRTKRKIPCT